MHFLTILALATAAAASPLAFPMPQGTGSGSDSCPSETLEAKTWTDLKLDTFLKDWSASNVTAAKTNNVQALADSFGAPNFFCGMDAFCNAGQPCLPVSLPGWYTLVAIQNWNNFMNSLNTAIGFGSTINSLILPSIVKDFYPSPKDDITPLKDLTRAFTTVLSFIPLTGAINTANTVVQGTANFINGFIVPPVATDQFVAWSDIASSLSTVLSDYQKAVGDATKKILDAEVGAKGGINEAIAGGQFLGVSQNFTQTDLQDIVTDTITMAALGMVLNARKVFIYYGPGANCKEVDEVSEHCANGRYMGFLRADGGSANNFDKESKLLLEKYGMTKDQMLAGPVRCFEANGRKQLADGFGDILPMDSKTDCVFNVQVCDRGADTAAITGDKSIVDSCRDLGLTL